MKKYVLLVVTFAQKDLAIKTTLRHKTAFDCRKDLGQHVVSVHEKKKAFVCPICAHAFSRGTYLKRHIEENTRLHKRNENFKLFNLD